MPLVSITDIISNSRPPIPTGASALAASIDSNQVAATIVLVSGIVAG